MEYKRSDRVADLLQKEIADLVLRQVEEPRVADITISGVRVSDDLKHARVFFCVMVGSERGRCEKKRSNGPWRKQKASYAWNLAGG